MAQNQTEGRLEANSFIYKEITWEIPNILPLPNLVDTPMRSAEFSFACSTWALSLYPYGQKRYKTQSFVDVMLERRQYLEPKQQVFYKIFFQNRKGKQFNPFTNCKTFTPKEDESGVISYIPHKDLVSSKKNLTPGNTLTVVCKMRMKSTVEAMRERKVAIKPGESIKSETSEQTPVYKNLPTATPGNKVLSDFQELLRSGECSDLIIVVKGQKFESHRAILCSRSPVFASMLKHDGNEVAGHLEIDDCNPEDFPAFLHFLYCGSTEKLTWQNAWSLYRVAGKYNMQDLKAECVKLMKHRLTVENFCDLFNLSLQYSETDLQKHSTEFFKRNLPKIIVTAKWQAFLSENSVVGNELLVKALAVDRSSNP